MKTLGRQISRELLLIVILGFGFLLIPPLVGFIAHGLWGNFLFGWNGWIYD